MDYVMEHLKDANFDPEFYAQYEKAIVAHYNSQFGTNITPKRKVGNEFLATYKVLRCK